MTVAVLCARASYCDAERLRSFPRPVGAEFAIPIFWEIRYSVWGQIMPIPLLLPPPRIIRPSYGPAFPNVKHWWGHNLFAYSRSKTTFPYMPNVPSLLGKNLIAKIVSPSLALSLCMSDRTSEPSERMRTLRNWYSPYFGRLVKSYILIRESKHLSLSPPKILTFRRPCLCPSVCPFLHQA